MVTAPRSSFAWSAGRGGLLGSPAATVAPRLPGDGDHNALEPLRRLAGSLPRLRVEVIEDAVRVPAPPVISTSAVPGRDGSAQVTLRLPAEPVCAVVVAPDGRHGVVGGIPRAPRRRLSIGPGAGMDLQEAELAVLPDIVFTPPRLERRDRLGEIGNPELVEPPLLGRPFEDLLRCARAGAVDPVVVPAPVAVSPEVPWAGGPALGHVLVPVLPPDLGIGRDPETVRRAGRAGRGARDGRQLHLVDQDRRLRPSVDVLDDHPRDALTGGAQVAERNAVPLPLPGHGITAEIGETARPAD